MTLITKKKRRRRRAIDSAPGRNKKFSSRLGAGHTPIYFRGGSIYIFSRGSLGASGCRLAQAQLPLRPEALYPARATDGEVGRRRRGGGCGMRWCVGVRKFSRQRVKVGCVRGFFDFRFFFDFFFFAIRAGNASAHGTGAALERGGLVYRMLILHLPSVWLRNLSDTLGIIRGV